MKKKKKILSLWASYFHIWLLLFTLLLQVLLKLLLIGTSTYGTSNKYKNKPKSIDFESQL